MLNEPEEDESGKSPSTATYRQPTHRPDNFPTVRNVPAAGAAISVMNLLGFADGAVTCLSSVP